MFIFESSSGKGGVGKTTLAWALACYWAMDGANVCIVDGDLTSHQLTDTFNEFGEQAFDLVDAIPDESAGYDICIIDRAPSTKTERTDCTAVLYIMEPHRLAIQAYDRARRIVDGRNAVLVVNKCDFRKAKHKANASTLEKEHGCLIARVNVTYEALLENGVNLYSMRKTESWNKAVKEIAQIAKALERFMV